MKWPNSTRKELLGFSLILESTLSLSQSSNNCFWGINEKCLAKIKLINNSKLERIVKIPPARWPFNPTVNLLLETSGGFVSYFVVGNFGTRERGTWSVVVQHGKIHPSNRWSDFWYWKRCYCLFCRLINQIQWTSGHCNQDWPVFERRCRYY